MKTGSMPNEMNGNQKSNQLHADFSFISHSFLLHLILDMSIFITVAVVQKNIPRVVEVGDCWYWQSSELSKGAIWIEELPYSTSLPPWGLMKVQEREWTLYRWEKAHTFFSTRSNHSARQELIGCDYSHTFACLRSNSDTKNSVIIIIGRSF